MRVPQPKTPEWFGRTAEGRKVIRNPDGTFSTESSVTVEDPRRAGHWINIPTIFDGRRVPMHEALSIVRKAGFRDPDTGRQITGIPSSSGSKPWSTAEEAALRRHQEQAADPGYLDAVRGYDTARQFASGEIPMSTGGSVNAAPGGIVDPPRPPPAASPTAQAMLSDPRMERIRQADPEKYQELLARAQGAGGVYPRQEGQEYYPRDPGAAPLPEAPRQASPPPFSWEQMKADPFYEGLDHPKREQLRQSYYQDFVAPTGKSWEDFDAETAPGFFERVGDAASGSLDILGGQFMQSAGLVLKQMGAADSGEALLATGRDWIQEGGRQSIQLPYGDDQLVDQLRNLATVEFWQKFLGESIPQSMPYLGSVIAGTAAGAAAGSAIPVVGTAVGAIIGGMTAAGATVALQRAGSAYDEYRQAHPEAPDEDAVDYGLKAAGIEAAVESAAVPLGLVGRSLTPVKHALVQVALNAAQGVGSQASSNVVQRDVDPNTPLTRGLVAAGVGEGLFEAPGITMALRRSVPGRASAPGVDPAATRPAPAAEEAPFEPTLDESASAAGEGAIPQPAPEPQRSLPSPENLDQGAEALYQELVDRGVPAEEAQAEVRQRIRAYRELREGRSIEVPAEDGLQPGELVDVQEGPGPNTVRGIVSQITPEGMARIQILSEDAAGRDFLAWASEGMVGEMPTAEGLARYPGEPAPPEQDAWRVVERGTGRELGSTMQEDEARGLAEQFGNAEVLPPRNAPVEQAQQGAQIEREQPQRPTPPETRVAQEAPPAPQEPPQQRGISAEVERLRRKPAAPSPDAAFAEQMRQVAPQLRKRAERLAGPDRADDLLQDTLLRMWEKRETFDPSKPFANWAQTVLHSVHANRARAFSRRPESALDSSAEPNDVGVVPEQEARFDLQMGARESGSAPLPDKPPAAEARAQGAARQPAGPERPEATQRTRLAAEVERARKKPAAPPPREPIDQTRLGREDTVSTESGRQVPVRYAVVDADELVASHDPEGRVNPEYPAHLQPRQRERVASRQQIDEIATRLNPQRLAESPEASSGAPIIGSDFAVESGNGRVLSVREAYRRGNAGAYKAMVAERAKALGVEESALQGVERPVLVRVRQGDMTPSEREAFTREANVSAVATMSPVEQALSDSRRADFTKLQVADDGSIDTPSNREFIRLFLEELPAAERGQLLAENGSLNQLGRTRIRNAVFAAAYGDVDAVARMSESTDDNVRNITTGMLIAAPRFAQVRRQISEGKLFPIDPTPVITSAAEGVSSLRAEGIALADMLRHGELLGPRFSDETAQIMQSFDEMKRSGKRIGEFLNDIAKWIEDHGSPAQEGLFAAETPTVSGAIEGVRRSSASRQGDLLSGEQSPAAQGDEGGPGPGSGPQLSQAPLSEISARRSDLERQLRLAALESRGGDAAAKQRMASIQAEIRAVDDARAESRQRAARQVLSESRRLYAADAPMVRMVDALESGAAGDYQAAKRIVQVSLDALDPLGTFKHEAMHDMRRWFLTPLENEALNAAFAPGSRAARDVVSTLERLGYDEAAKQARESTEERIAHAFSLRRTGDYNPRPAIRRVLDKIAQWMERVANLFRGRGFTSAEDIFTAIEEGRVAGRPQRGGAGSTPAVQESRSPLTADTRSKARRIKVPPRKGQTLGETAKGLREGLKEGEAPRGAYTSGTNTMRLNFGADASNSTVEQIAERFGEDISRAAGGQETVEQWMVQASRLLRNEEVTKDKLLKRSMRQPFRRPSEALAYAQILKDSARHLRQRAAAFESLSKADRDRFVLQTAEQVRMQQAFQSALTEGARVQRAQQERSADIEGLRAEAIASLIEQKQGEVPLNQLAGMIAALETPEQIGAFLKDAYKPTWFDKFSEAWINSIFTPLSLARNLMGNSVFLTTQPFERMAAAGFGKAAGRTDRAQAGEGMAMIRGLLSAFPEALRLARHTWMTEQTQGPIPWEGPRQAISGKKGWWIRTMGRTLLATDQFFKALGYRMELYAQAHRTAAREGRTGDAFHRRVRQLIDNPTEDIQLAAIDFSQYVTFTREAGPFARALMQAREAIPFPGRLILPFINTPAQLFTTAMERTPFAVGMPSFWKDVLGADGVKRDQALARVFLGSAAAGSFVMMAASGLITGNGPDDPREKALWWLKPHGPNGVRWQPNSFWNLITGEYASYAGMEPLSTIMSIVATLVETGDRASMDEVHEIAGSVIGTLAKNMLSKNYLQGITEFVQAYSEPDRYGEQWFNRVTGSLAQAAMPGFGGTVRHIARLIDPELKQAKTLGEEIAARIPVVSKGVPARVDASGQDITFEGALGPDFISPMFTSGQRGSRVAAELIKLDVTISRPRGEINGHELSTEQRAEYERDAGARVWARLERVTDAPSWQRLAPDAKERRVRTAISFERRAATMRMKQRYPELRRPARRGA